MISEFSVRDKLLELSQNELSIEEFENWLVAAAWNMHYDSSPEAVDLVSSIHLLLSERDDRILNESELRSGLLSLLNNPIHVEIKCSGAPVVFKVQRSSSPLVHAEAKL